MLGEKLGEAQAATVTRVLPTEGSSPRFETSADGSGTLLGVPVKFLATYWSEVRADGSIYGECPNSGVFMTEDGEAATFIASGAGGSRVRAEPFSGERCIFRRRDLSWRA
jgi:hypothetical protein